MRIRVFSLLLIAVCGVSFAATIRAQQPTRAQGDAIRQSCRADYQSYCASVPTGGKASLACLQQHQSNLSPACSKAVAAVGPPGAPSAASPGASVTPAQQPAASPRQELALMRSQCSADYRRYCAGVRPGGGRAISCLADHQESLSRGCRESLMSLRSAQ